MNCNCLGEANEKLKEQGTQIAFRFAVRTVKRGKKTVNEMYSAIEIPTRKLSVVAVGFIQQRSSAKLFVPPAGGQ